MTRRITKICDECSKEETYTGGMSFYGWIDILPNRCVDRGVTYASFRPGEVCSIGCAIEWLEKQREATP